MLICPGWCGEEFVNADVVKNYKNLQKHITRCAKGHATVSLLEKFAEWMMAERTLEGPGLPELEAKYAAQLAAEFLAANPTTDPRVQYLRSWAR